MKWLARFIPFPERQAERKQGVSCLMNQFCQLGNGEKGSYFAAKLPSNHGVGFFKRRSQNSLDHHARTPIPTISEKQGSKAEKTGQKQQSVKHTGN